MFPPLLLQVIAGVADTNNGTQDIIAFSKRIPNASLVTIKDCGHLPQEERPVEFLNAVSEFPNMKYE